MYSTVTLPPPPAILPGIADKKLMALIDRHQGKLGRDGDVEAIMGRTGTGRRTISELDSCFLSLISLTLH